MPNIKENVEAFKAALDQLQGTIQNVGILFPAICEDLDNNIQAKNYQFIESCEIPDIPEEIVGADFHPIDVVAIPKPDLPIELMAQLLPCALPERSICPELVTTISNKKRQDLPESDEPWHCIETFDRDLFGYWQLNYCMRTEVCCCSCKCENDNVQVDQNFKLEWECDPIIAFIGGEYTLGPSNEEAPGPYLTLFGHTFEVKSSIDIEADWCDEHKVEINPKLELTADCDDSFDFRHEVEAIPYSDVPSRFGNSGGGKANKKKRKKRRKRPTLFKFWGIEADLDFSTTTIDIDMCTPDVLIQPSFDVEYHCVDKIPLDFMVEALNGAQSSSTSRIVEKDPTDPTEPTEPEEPEKKKKETPKAFKKLEILKHVIIVRVGGSFEVDFCAEPYPYVKYKPVIDVETECTASPITTTEEKKSNTVDIYGYQLTSTVTTVTTVDWCAGTVKTVPTQRLTVTAPYLKSACFVTDVSLNLLGSGGSGGLGKKVTLVEDVECVEQKITGQIPLKIPEQTIEFSISSGTVEQWLNHVKCKLVRKQDIATYDENDNIWWQQVMTGLTREGCEFSPVYEYMGVAHEIIPPSGETFTATIPARTLLVDGKNLKLSPVCPVEIKYKEIYALNPSANGDSMLNVTKKCVELPDKAFKDNTNVI